VLDVSALPSPYGIGDVGPTALAWIDRLQESGQSWWHALQSSSPVSGDSVHQCYSSFAGNVLLISPDWLIEDGLLSPRECECVALPEGSIDYDVVVPFKHWLLDKAWQKFNQGARKALRRSYDQFRTKQEHWLEDYALFCALKLKYRGMHYLEWPVDLVRRNQSALAAARHDLGRQIDRVRFSQFLLHRQTRRLKDYASQNGVRLIGDLPFFVSADSSDAWAYPELFARGEQYAPVLATDLVPFCFSSSGPSGSDADRGALSRVSYRWCVDRLHALLTRVDVARVDVRALVAGRRALGGRLARGEECAAELRGLVSDRLRDGSKSSERSQVLETRVVQFVFDGRSSDTNPGHNYSTNSAVYAALRENTGKQFSRPEDDQPRLLLDDPNEPADEAPAGWESIRLAWSSAAGLAMISFADLLNLSERPGDRDGDNGHHRWRCRKDMLSASAFSRLGELTRTSNRSADLSKASRPAVLKGPRRPTRIVAAITGV